MKLKDNLILREVAGQYVIVPVKKRSLEIPKVTYMTKDAALLWNHVYGRNFDQEDLVKFLKKQYPHTPEDCLKQEAENFIEGVQSRWLIENKNGGVGHISYHYVKKTILKNKIFNEKEKCNHGKKYD